MAPSTDGGARVIAGALWVFLIVSAVTVALMCWHPWVHPWLGVPRTDR